MGAFRPGPKTRLAFLAASLVLAAAVFPVSSFSRAPALAEAPAFEPGVVLVRWGPGIRTQDNAVRALGAQPEDNIPALGITKLRVPPGKEQEAIDALKRAGAEIAGLNHLRWATQTPNDPLYGYQWGPAKIGAGSAWDVTTGSSSITVAVIDTGMDMAHPDRPQNLIRGADYVVDISGNTLVSGDPQGHGTHVSGIVAARMNNGAGVAGVAPGASVMPVRVLDAYGYGTTYITAKGIIYAADHGAKIINLSLSGTTEDPAEVEAINYAHSKGVLIIAAAGNEYLSGNPVTYPAASEHVVAVAATDSGDNSAYYSEAGSFVDLAAPGGSGGSTFSGGVVSTCTGGSYCAKSGTSMASPHVAGVAALIWSINPSLTPDQVEAILRQSVADLGSAGWDDTFGYGRIDAYKAVQQAQTTLTYAAQYVGQSFPIVMTAGQVFTAHVDIKNTGGATWFQGGQNPVRLGTSQPLDRLSPFYTPGDWVSPARASTLDQSSVAPGQVGRFTFALTAPAAGGTFTESFQVVVEGKAWLSEPQFWFRVPVSIANLQHKIYVPTLLRESSSGW